MEKGKIRILTFNCHKCNHELIPKESYPFGEKIECPICKTSYEVEHDYSGDDYGCLSFYLIESEENVK